MGLRDNIAALQEIFVTLEFSDISNSLETDAKGKVPTMHWQKEILVKAVEIMKEGQEDTQTRTTMKMNNGERKVIPQPRGGHCWP